MGNLSSLTISELENILKNYENEEFDKIKSCAIELRNRNGGLYSNPQQFTLFTKIINHFGISDISDFVTIKNEKKDLPKSEIQINKSSLAIIFEDYSKSFLNLLISVAITVLSSICGVLILLSEDRSLIKEYTIVSICISVVVFFVSVFALYNLYKISERASKQL